MLQDIPIVFLAGGAGSRLREIAPKIPKSLFPVAGARILDWQINEFRKHGANTFIFLLYHQADMIRDHVLGTQKSSENYTFFQETSPRGTGGALIDALRDLPKAFFLVFADMVFSLKHFSKQITHIQKQSLMSLHINDHMEDSDKYFIHEKGHLRHSNSDTPLGAEFANAGIYFFRKSDLMAVAGAANKSTKVDLEKDIIPRMIDRNLICGLIFSDYLRDLGTPTRIKRFEEDVASGLVAEYTNPNDKIENISCKTFLSLRVDSTRLRELRRKRFAIKCCGTCQKSDLYQAFQQTGALPIQISCDKDRR